MTTHYNKLPFLQKQAVLTVLVTLPILLILLLAGVGFVKHNNKLALKKETQTISDITVSAVIPDLLFNDVDAIKATLQNIKSNTEVEYVCIKTIKSSIITSLGDTEGILYEDYLTQEKSEFYEGQYYHYSPINYKSNHLGTLITVSNTNQITATINKMILALVISISLFSLIWFILNNHVQKILLRPLLTLSKTIDTVVKTGNYNKKLIEQTFDDEVGVLYNNFNTMLHQIETTTVSKNYLDSIMSALAEMIIVLDIGGRIAYVNKAVEKNTGYLYKELRGKSPTVLSPDFKFNNIQDKFETTIKTKSKKSIYISVSTASFYSNEGYERLILSIRNITEQKKAEAKVQKYYTVLEETNAELAQKNEALEHFTSVASHDMKTPLRSISSFITLIERKLSKEKNKELNEYITFVKNGATHLNMLINDTLEFARVGSKALEYKEVNICEVLDDIKGFVGNKAEIKFGDLPNIETNQNLLHKLFQNIIENGIKYNDQDSKIISITAYEKDKNIQFAIKDNGIGIEEQYHKVIFEQHRRLHNNAKYKGTGLGLAICKKITEQLHGKIWLTSEPNVGSTFYIELPKTIDYKNLN